MLVWCLLPHWPGLVGHGLHFVVAVAVVVVAIVVRVLIPKENKYGDTRGLRKIATATPLLTVPLFFASQNRTRVLDESIIPKKMSNPFHLNEMERGYSQSRKGCLVEII